MKSPCAKCQHSTMCAEMKLACGDFSYYIRTGRVRNVYRTPSRALFENHFQTANKKASIQKAGLMERVREMWLVGDSVRGIQLKTNGGQRTIVKYIEKLKVEFTELGKPLPYCRCGLPSGHSGTHVIYGIYPSKVKVKAA